MAKQSQKLLDQVRGMTRCKHYSIHTEESYNNWIRRFILYHNIRHTDVLNKGDLAACNPLDSQPVT